jgi:tetratricopeptide (TPR) repeat protein
MSLNRLQEARAILDEAHARKLDESLLQNRYQLAFLNNDGKEMESIVAASVGQPDDESDMLASQADTEAFYGRLGRARELSKRAVQAALSAGSKDSAANWEVTAALREAEFGNGEIARQQAKDALALSPSKAVKIAAGLALARSGEAERAREIVGRLRNESPKDTLLENFWIPTIRAAIALERADSQEALKQLDITTPYELGGDRPPFTAGATLYPVYLRALAYLRGNDSDKALQEFQKISDSVGLVWNFPIGALARLRRAQAYAARGDISHAQDAYQNLFSIWSNADTGTPIFDHARKEYAAIKSGRSRPVSSRH